MQINGEYGFDSRALIHELTIFFSSQSSASSWQINLLSEDLNICLYEPKVPSLTLPKITFNREFFLDSVVNQLCVLEQHEAGPSARSARDPVVRHC